MKKCFGKTSFVFLTVLMSFWFGIAGAASPVVLTTDRTTTLDLTSKEGAAVDLLECNLSVLEENQNLYLLHSKGRLLIPRLAVKRMMDDGIVEIDTKGSLLGMPLVGMLLPYGRKLGEMPSPHAFKESADQERNGGPLFEESGVHFFVAERESKIASTIKRRLPKAKLVPSKDLENGNVVILLNPGYLHPAGGYPLMDDFLSEWLRKSPLIQIDYSCGVRADKTINPYFKQ